LRAGDLRAGEVRALADRLRAGPARAEPASGAALLMHKADGERPVGGGWRSAGGRGLAVWTVELEHE